MTIKCDDTVDICNGEHVDNILIISRTGKEFIICEVDDGTFQILNSKNYLVGELL